MNIYLQRVPRSGESVERHPDVSKKDDLHTVVAHPRR